MAPLPTGTVTFLFTDVQGFGQLLSLGVHPDLLDLAFRRCEEVVRTTIDQLSGYVFRAADDEFYAVFASAPAAVTAAQIIQHSLRGIRPDADPVSAGLSLKARIALHTGSVSLQDGAYNGPALLRTVGLLGVTHGGQVLLSRVTMDLVQDDLPAGVSLKDLGPHHLPDLDRPEHVFQLVHPDLPSHFPPLHAPPVIPVDLPRGELLNLLFELHRRLEANEQRQTFLSVDTVGSSEMKRLGTALAAEYSFRQFQSWIEEVVRRWGGGAHSPAGDGVMCLFSSDAQALRAARELLEGIARFNAEQNRLPVPFRTRLGVSAGQIAFDADEPMGQLQSAIIDRAAALQKRAQPGSVLISAEVAAAALIELGGLTPLEEPIAGQPAFEWRPREDASIG